MDVQDEPCLIPRAAPLCEICRAKGDFNLKVLSRQLRSLYDLDPDVYKLALNEVPRYLRSIVLRNVMLASPCRTDATAFALAPRRIDMLIEASRGFSIEAGSIEAPRGRSRLGRSRLVEARRGWFDRGWSASMVWSRLPRWIQLEIQARRPGSLRCP